MLFMNKANRDAKAKELRSQGHQVRRSSIRNQLLHPQYVADYEQETGTALTAADRGFGNRIYKTVFDVLYEVTVIDERGRVTGPH